MRHEVKQNHKFVVVAKDGVHAHYSAQHLGRVEGWINRQSEEDKNKFNFEILNREDWINRSNEEVEISFIPMVSPEKDENGQYIEKTTTILRRDVGSCCDPRTERYWTM